MAAALETQRSGNFVTLLHKSVRDSIFEIVLLRTDVLCVYLFTTS